MTRFWQVLLTSVNVLAGAAASYHWNTPTPAVVSAGIQGLITQAAHQYNTDGTPQTVAYTSAPPPIPRTLNFK